MSAFVGEIIEFLKSHLSAHGCSRRNPSRAHIHAVSSERVGKLSKPKSKIPEKVSYNGLKPPCHDRSNDSTDGSDLAALSTSTDGSDMETTSSQAPSIKPKRSNTNDSSAKAPERQTPTGFSPPPGLLPPRCGDARSRPVNPTLRHFQGMKYSQGNPPATMEAIKREMLNDVMSKLDSQDAQILRSLFDSRQANVGQRTHTGHGSHAIRPQNRSHQAQTPLAEENSLRSNLRRMATIDERRILFVKKISKLGLNSAQLLEQHFSQFGSVEEVLCTHAIDKRSDSGRPRYRPTNTGFVIMKTVEDAVTAFRTGSEQVVSGVSIHVGTYQHQQPKESRNS